MGWARTLVVGQTCRIRVYDLDTDEAVPVHEDSSVLFEAPNWVGDTLVVNGDGVLWTLPADGSRPPGRMAHEGLPELNNDHVVAPDGETVYVSANDGHLYAAPLAGGEVRRITDADRYHFLHGVSPDGATLAYVALGIRSLSLSDDRPLSRPDDRSLSLSDDRSLSLSKGRPTQEADPWAEAHIRLIGVDGTGDRALTDPPGREDGPEFTPDGAWVLFNTERFSPGHAQLARIRVDGSGLEQLTRDERVNWFPHPSPDGSRVVYLSFPPGTQGHPADLDVELRLVEGSAWTAPRTLLKLEGGQGTINVPSWAPDGRRFAFVDYPRGAAR